MQNSNLRIGTIGDVLRNLRGNTAGNTLAMVAAGLVPLTAMIGSGVDISRAYMVQSRLQQACDAGVLAGRKAMADGEYTTEAQGIAEDYFDVNFPVGYLETTDRSFTTNNPSGGSAVVGTAAVKVPTVIMDMFSVTELDASVNCTAQLEISNSDITFVLDNTGSMACPEDSNSTQCSNYFAANGNIPVEGVAFGGLSTTSRMSALKTALDGFYSTIDEAADSSGARIRYAFVPYSQTVNTGYLLPSDYLVDDHDYQSIRPITEYFRSQNPVHTANCASFFGTWPGYRVFGRFDADYGGCIWEAREPYYIQRNLDVSAYKQGVPVDDPTEQSSGQLTWAGCIEERDTVGSNSITFDASTGTWSPADLFDLDIDSAPISDETRWRPYWPEVVRGRSHGSLESRSDFFTQTACPGGAATLTEYASLSNFQDYQSVLQPDGGTYHDIGLLWGARLSSPEGIFGTLVSEEPTNGGFVGRHLVWMSDGDLGVSENAYTAYGVEKHDGNITGNANGGAGTFGNQETNVRRRYRQLCTAIKAKGIRLWVVAFNTSLTSDLTECASSNSSFVANNAAELADRFAEIAEQIADLRLTD